MVRGFAGADSHGRPLSVRWWNKVFAPLVYFRRDACRGWVSAAPVALATDAHFCARAPDRGRFGADGGRICGVIPCWILDFATAMGRLMALVAVASVWLFATLAKFAFGSRCSTIAALLLLLCN